MFNEYLKTGINLHNFYGAAYQSSANSRDRVQHYLELYCGFMADLLRLLIGDPLRLYCSFIVDPLDLCQASLCFHYNFLGTIKAALYLQMALCPSSFGTSLWLHRKSNKDYVVTS